MINPETYRRRPSYSVDLQHANSQDLRAAEASDKDIFATIRITHEGIDYSINVILGKIVYIYGPRKKAYDGVAQIVIDSLGDNVKKIVSHYLYREVSPKEGAKRDRKQKTALLKERLTKDKLADLVEVYEGQFDRVDVTTHLKQLN